MIDIKGAITGGVDIVFQQLAQLVEDVKIVKRESEGYDPVSGVVADTSSSFIVGGLFLDAKVSDGRYGAQGSIPGDAVEVGDRTLLLRASDLSTTINKDLVVTRMKVDTTWNIVGYKLDPTESFYEVHIRGAT